MIFFQPDLCLVKGMWLKMKQIDIKTLINEINLNKNKQFILEFEGIIKSKIQIKNLEMQEDAEYINILSKESEKIQLLKHQIMKIEKIENEYILKFDALQNIKILLF